MKYVISWRERPAASAKDYEAAHERVLQIFTRLENAREFYDPPVCGPGWRLRRLYDRGDRQSHRHSLCHEHLCGIRIQGGAGRRCDGRGGGRAQSHRISQEKLLLSSADGHFLRCSLLGIKKPQLELASDCGRSTRKLRPMDGDLRGRNHAEGWKTPGLRSLSLRF